MKSTVTALLACLVLAVGCTSEGRPVTSGAEPAPAPAHAPASVAVPSPVASTSRPALPPLRPALEVRRGIDWDRVGAGWHLIATESGTRRHGSLQPVSARLQLLGPTGTRTDLLVMDRDVLGTTRAPRWATPFPQVEDLSPADRTVLLLFHSDFRDATAVSLDLETGEQQRSRVPPGTSGLALRDGGFTYVGFRGRVVSVDWDGTSSPLGRTEGAVLPLPDRSGVVVGRPLRVLGLDGSRRSLPQPGDGEACGPRRWWDAGTVLATCTDGSLWLVPLSGDGASVLTGPADPRSTRLDFGADDAVRLGGETYVQKMAGCGAGWVARRNADGTTTDLDGTREQRVLGTAGDRLLVQRFAPCGSTGEHVPLVLLDPVSLDDRPLLRLTGREELRDLRPWDRMPGRSG